MDTVSKAIRSWNMSRIRSCDTMPERAVRSLLHRMGYRFRLHHKALPGRPDVVLTRYRTVVLVHGCFWHRHEACRFAYTPKTRQRFWRAKFTANVVRDRVVQKELRKRGWRVVVVWECELRNMERLATRLAAAMKRSSMAASTLKQ
jgi:DNA mismatch endonuclease (patch repair protein)